MTLLTMIEVVKQSFPALTEAQVKLDLNNAYRLYSEDTRLPFEDFDVVIDMNHLCWQEDRGGGTIATTPLEIKQGDYILPSPVSEIFGVTAYDSLGNVVDKPEYCIWYLKNLFNISDIMHDSLLVSGTLPSGIARLRFRCSVIPPVMSLDDDEPNLPEQFHQALIDHVLMKHFALRGVLQQSGWFRSSYQALVTAGKRFFNRTFN
jgi:hypothetical protein